MEGERDEHQKTIEKLSGDVGRIESLLRQRAVELKQAELNEAKALAEQQAAVSE